jgi:hypothetical protein
MVEYTRNSNKHNQYIKFKSAYWLRSTEFLTYPRLALFNVTTPIFQVGPRQNTNSLRHDNGFRVEI